MTCLGTDWASNVAAAERDGRYQTSAEIAEDSPARPNLMPRLREVPADGGPAAVPLRLSWRRSHNRWMSANSAPLPSSSQSATRMSHYRLRECVNGLVPHAEAAARHESNVPTFGRPGLTSR